MAAPRLSICIPTYGRADLLRETLAHLVASSPAGLEVVVADNASPDHTPAVVREFEPRFPHFRSIRHARNLGAFRNHSASLALATGTYCYTLSDDDEILAPGLEAAMRILDDNPGVAGVYGGCQEWDRATGKTRTFAAVAARTDFARGDKAGVIGRFGLLWFPVCRTALIQRFFTYDDKSFGMWPLVGTLLERGGVSVIPDVLYKHAQTSPRMEYELTETWYHDRLRSQFEVYFGRIGPQDPSEIAQFVHARVGPAYLQGFRFAMVKKEFLKARHFLLRARAYGLVSEPEVAEWERRAIVAMVTERLRNHIALLPDVREVLFEETPALRGVKSQFVSIRDGIVVGAIGPGAWRQRPLAQHQFLVSGVYDSDLAPGRQRALEDLVDSCRLTDQDLEAYL